MLKIKLQMVLPTFMRVQNKDAKKITKISTYFSFQIKNKKKIVLK